MGYMHINNLYKDQHVLMFKECYALEKVHGTSAHVAWDQEKVEQKAKTDKYQVLTFYGGGEKHERFAALFDKDALLEAFQKLGHAKVTVYGEAYGGSQQKMAATYGPDLKFIVFDVQVGDTWLSVPDMDQVATQLGFEVVPWEKTSTDVPILDAIRDRPSEVAIRRGITTPMPREGVVLRPLEEMTTNNGQRIISKHKGAGFEERMKQPKVVDTSKLEVLKEAEAIAQEWVTEMRLDHVLDKLLRDQKPGIEHMGNVIKAMQEDVFREAAGEVVDSKESRSAVSKRTALLFKQHLQNILHAAVEKNSEALKAIE